MCYRHGDSQSNADDRHLPADDRRHLQRRDSSADGTSVFCGTHSWRHHARQATKRVSVSIPVCRSYFAPGEGAKYCDEYVCLSVCLLTHLRNMQPYLPHFCACCLWPVAMAWFFSVGVAIRYVLPFLWMTLCRHICCDGCIMRISKHNSHNYCLDSNHILSRKVKPGRLN